ncbi:chloride channel protein [Azospirillum sp. ST 5-10]|uniref:chloride channel protein n=1 Tax=unclassified Azospirillum TaxID=2630922 RepID=UPI003F49E1F6
MPRTLLPRLLIRLRRVVHNDRIVLMVLALVVGGLAGGAAILFRETIALTQGLFYGWTDERFAHLAATLPAWHLVAGPAVGGLLVGLFIRAVLPGARPQGVAEVMEATAVRGGRMDLGVGVAAAAANAVSLGVGASLGREGPVVHLGAAISSWAARAFRLTPALLRTLLGCGVAAAVAASFNAPIAGVLFALEVVTGNSVLSAFAPVVLAAVIGTALGRAVYGGFPAFVLPMLDTPPALEFPSFALLGVVAAAVAVALMHGLLWSQRAFLAAGRRTGLPRWLHPALGGLALGLLAIAYPEVLGVGYEATDTALRGGYGLGGYAALLLVKLVAVCLCFGAGFGGGIFSPSLFLGAMAGGVFGLAAETVLGGGASATGLYVMVGMGAVAGPMLGAPISTILIIFELTGNYPATLAAMLATVVSATLVRAAVGHSFFTWQLALRGIDLSDGHELGQLASVRVRDLMRGDSPVLAADAGRDALAAALRAGGNRAILVVEPESGRLAGLLSAGDAAGALAGGRPAGAEDGTATARALLRSLPPLTPTTDLREALRRFDDTRAPALPVVADTATLRATGVIYESDALRAFRRLVTNRGRG